MAGEYEVKVQTVSGITSSAPKAIINIPAGGQVRLYPTSAGTATVYSTGSTLKNAQLDVATSNAAVTGSTNAKWSIWGAGSVVADTVQSALVPQTAIAVVVTSGTWTLEVTQ
jgi:hypothetical protein